MGGILLSDTISVVWASFRWLVVGQRKRDVEMSRDTIVLVILAAGIAFSLGWTCLRPQRRCPKCNNLLPKYRAPENAKQMYWGGWTCPHCGVEVKASFFGRPAGYQEPDAKA